VSVTHDTIEGIPAAVKKLSGHVDNSLFPDIIVEIPLTLTLPEQVRMPVPVVMEFGFVFPPGFKFPDRPGKAERAELETAGPVERLGLCNYRSFKLPGGLGAGLTKGIIGLVNKGQRRKPDDWGACEPGHGVQAVLWTILKQIRRWMQNELPLKDCRDTEGSTRDDGLRFTVAVAFVGSSGAGGAKILRRVFGEQVENLASSGEYHWFAGNFLKYAGPLTRNDLPVDAHELVALCAPRPVFISAGSFEMEGGWVDAKGMFLGGAYASPVYELLGKRDWDVRVSTYRDFLDRWRSSFPAA